MKEVIRQVAESAVMALSPPPRFAVVDSVDDPARAALVHFPDEPTATFVVSYGGTCPAPGDTVRVAGRSGARYIDDVVSSVGWTAATLSGAWANVSGSQPVEYRRVGDMVHTRGHVNAGTTGTNIFTFPPGFRPPFSFDIPAASWGTGQIEAGALWVQAGGAVVGHRRGVSLSWSSQFSVLP
jgi:hypothetical protein